MQRNLPNKQRIGKQDPYCSVQLGHQKNKTQAVKRGGQTPHWDAQLEFEVWEQRGDETPVVATESGGIAPAVDDADLPNQATVGRAKGKSTAAASKKILKIACYADDPREPELIGETELDYGPTLKKGEFDGEPDALGKIACLTLIPRRMGRAQVPRQVCWRGVHRDDILLGCELWYR